MPTLTLRALFASAFTTKGSALDSTEFDNNFIQLKAEIDSLNTALGAITSHVKNQDTFLDQGGGNQVSAAQLKPIVTIIPTTLSGKQFQLARVNEAETALEYVAHAHASYYELANGNQTNIAVAGTFANIDCNLASGDSVNEGFSVAQNVITYDNTDDITVRLSWTCSIIKTGGASSDECHIAIFKNGAKQKGEGVRDVDNSSLGSLSLHIHVDVESGDNLSLQITNDDSTSDIIVQDQTVTVTKIH